MRVDQNLIFDVGVNKGEDTSLYLEKGFRVVGIEANPLLAHDLRATFADPIARGDLILLNLGVWSERTKLTFYRNLDNDHWSSFDPVYGCRNNTRFETSEIECVTILELINDYGLPRFLKIDVEGADRLIVADLAKHQLQPPYVSVEEYGVQAIDNLHEVGYEKFKFAAQRDKSWAVPPNPPLEGRFATRDFSGWDSGLFGRELPGDWMPYEQARQTFVDSIRQPNGQYVGPEHEWYDIHATTE